MAQRKPNNVVLFSGAYSSNEILNTPKPDFSKLTRIARSCSKRLLSQQKKIAGVK
ncbi:MAG: hypothetical protein IJ158_12655 [Treponema sp.]|nr:hypothetical protein [Treponema sp.]